MSKKKSKKAEISGEKQKKRSYLFQPGQSGNPAGKPKGTLSITTAVKRRLEAFVKRGKTKRELDRLVDTILKKAIEDGDTHTIKAIWSYVDGLPKQSIDLTSLGEKIYTWDYGKSDNLPTKKVEPKVSRGKGKVEGSSSS